MPMAWTGGEEPAREAEKKEVGLSARIHLSRSWAVEKHFMYCKGPPKC